MAASDVPDLMEELTCSICLYYLNKPLAVERGHKSCCDCLLRNWKGSPGNSTCLKCKEIYKVRDPRCNLQLGMMAEIAKSSHDGLKD